MKHIFYIANIRLPTEKAHGVQIMKTCESFVKNGVNVTLIVPRRFNSLVQDPFEYYQVERKFNIVKVATLDLVFLGKVGFLVESFIFSECAAWYIRRHKTEDFVVYSRDTWPLINMMLLGWKLFWESHMGSTSFFTKLLLKRLQGLIVITHGLKDLYVTLGVTEERVIVASDAVDLTDFESAISKEEARKGLGLPLNKKVIMYIGLLDDWKGYRTFLEASKMVSGEDLVFVVIGGTNSQISELEVQYKKVFFLGYKPYRELPLHQRAADFLVIPNSGKHLISKLYTSPLKLFAHMASGVPIIASDLPSIREIVDESQVIFFEPDNALSLARIVEQSVAAPSLAQAELARKKVAQYTWDNRSRDIINFIRNNV